MVSDDFIQKFSGDGFLSCDMCESGASESEKDTKMTGNKERIDSCDLGSIHTGSVNILPIGKSVVYVARKCKQRKSPSYKSEDADSDSEMKETLIGNVGNTRVSACPEQFSVEENREKKGGKACVCASGSLTVGAPDGRLPVLPRPTWRVKAVD